MGNLLASASKSIAYNSETLVGDHPSNLTRPVFHSPELFSIILNALETH